MTLRCMIVFEDKDQRLTESQYPIPGFDYNEILFIVQLDIGAKMSLYSERLDGNGGVRMWWSKNRQPYVEIKNYGWEWVENVGGQMVRKTAKMKSKNIGQGARLFVEFTQRTVDRHYMATYWKKEETPWGK